MPHRLSLRAMSAAVARKELSPVELVAAHLRQIERCNPGLNAFVAVFADEALKAARKAEAAQVRDATLGRLHGLPVTVKDSFDMQGLPTLCGSRLRLDHRAEADSTAVGRLKEAGAIILGKTNCPEFLMNYETDNHITGRTNSPWDPERTAGGSSGGESAAIAAFCSPGGMGSDGGGSIRVPASFCGIAGLKPTPGRVPAVGHFPEICHPGGLLGVAGPMARSAADVRLLFEVVSGHDCEDPFSAPAPLRKPDLSALRVGMLEQIPGIPVQAPARHAVKGAAGLLESLGIPVEPFTSPELEQAPALWWFFFGRLNAPLLRVLVDTHEQDVHWTGVELMHLAEREPKPGALEILENLARRDHLRAALLRRMRDFPVLLLPACGIAAFRHREREWPAGERPISLLEAMAPATPFNLMGFPAVAVPIELTPEGLPVGVQLAGRPWEEELILELAVRLEEARGPFPAPPGAAG